MTFPKSYVPKIEKCLELQQAGFKQETIFYWWQDRTHDPKIFPLYEPEIYLAREADNPTDIILAAAPLDAEILEVLPKSITIKNTEYWLTGTIMYADLAVDWNYIDQNEPGIILFSKSWLSLPDLYLRLKKEGLI